MIQSSGGGWVLAVSMTLEILAQRIARSAELCGGTAQLARQSGINLRTLYHYLKGRSEPRASDLVAIAAAAGRPVAWLLGAGEEETLIPDHVPAFHQIDLQGREEEFSILGMDRLWLKQTYAADWRNLATLPAPGNAMEPTIRPGELLLIDRSPGACEAGEGLYLLRIADQLLVKRLQPLPDNRLRIWSDNTAYQAFTIAAANTSKLKILGKVVLVVGLRPV